MLEKKLLKGITWGHSRGITALLAGAQRYNELHPDVEITYGPKHQKFFCKV
jgi:multiple sugar transport system substrate-binding protein